MKYTEIVDELARLRDECEKLADQYGDKAMELIGDYPLYASTSNISYGEGILIASLFGNIDGQVDGDKLINEYFKSLPKGKLGSIEGYEKWLSERNKK